MRQRVEQFLQPRGSRVDVQVPGEEVGGFGQEGHRDDFQVLDHRRFGRVRVGHYQSAKAFLVRR
jgi:hypothetical protein